MLAIDGVDDIEDIADCMTEAAQRVHTVNITLAARDSVFDGIMIKEGEYLALLDGMLVTSGPDADAVVSSVAAELSSYSPEFITIFVGEGANEDETASVEDRISSASPGAEISVIQGDQPVYHYIISAE